MDYKETMEHKDLLLSKAKELIESGNFTVINKPLIDNVADDAVSTKSYDDVLAELDKCYSKKGYSTQKLKSTTGWVLLVSLIEEVDV